MILWIKVTLVNKWEISQGSWANSSSLLGPSRTPGGALRTCVDGSLHLLGTAPQENLGLLALVPTGPLTCFRSPTAIPATSSPSGLPSLLLSTHLSPIHPSNPTQVLPWFYDFLWSSNIVCLKGVFSSIQNSKAYSALYFSDFSPLHFSLSSLTRQSPLGLGQGFTRLGLSPT